MGPPPFGELTGEHRHDTRVVCQRRDAPRHRYISPGDGYRDAHTGYVTLRGVFGTNASLVFGVVLIAAGLSSSLVATMAGQTVMDGFIDLNVNV